MSRRDRGLYLALRRLWRWLSVPCDCMVCPNDCRRQPYKCRYCCYE